MRRLKIRFFATIYTSRSTYWHGIIHLHLPCFRRELYCYVGLASPWVIHRPSSGYMQNVYSLFQAVICCHVECTRFSHILDNTRKRCKYVSSGFLGSRPWVKCHRIWDHNILQKEIACGQGLRSSKGGCRERSWELGTDRHHLVESANMQVRVFVLYM